MNKNVMSRKDNKFRKWCLDPVNLRPMYDRERAIMDRMGFGSTIITEDDKKIITCKILSLGLWGNFYNPEKNLTTEEIYGILFGSKNV